MPELVAEVVEAAQIIGRHHAPVGIEIRNIGELGLLQPPPAIPGIDRRGLERAEQPAERDLLLVRDGLVREDEDGIAVERRLDLGEHPRCDCLREVDATDLGAETRMKRSSDDGHGSISVSAFRHDT